jgi:hypothetical protein
MKLIAGPSGTGSRCARILVVFLSVNFTAATDTAADTTSTAVLVDMGEQGQPVRVIIDTDPGIGEAVRTHTQQPA